MSTTFNFEIYFVKNLTDQESARFCKQMEAAVAEKKIILLEAVGEDFVKGFAEYGMSGMDKEDAINHFIQQVSQLDYKFEIKNCR